MKINKYILLHQKTSEFAWFMNIRLSRFYLGILFRNMRENFLIRDLFDFYLQQFFISNFQAGFFFINIVIKMWQIFQYLRRRLPKRKKTWEVNICDKHKIRLILMSSSRRRANGKIESMNKILSMRGLSSSGGRAQA